MRKNKDNLEIKNEITDYQNKTGKNATSIVPLKISNPTKSDLDYFSKHGKNNAEKSV